MKWITFGTDDEHAQALVDDTKETEGLMAYVTKDGDEIEIQTTNMGITDTDPRS